MSSSVSPADWPIAKLNSTFNSVRRIELICEEQGGEEERSYNSSRLRSAIRESMSAMGSLQ